MQTQQIDDPADKLPNERTASSKRIAWKKSLATTSERDSLITNSGEDRFSFEMRSETSKGRGNSLEQGTNNRLIVPSPGGNRKFYSTSPSTDEGIVFDEHVVDEDSVQTTTRGSKSASPKVNSHSQEKSMFGKKTDIGSSVECKSPPANNTLSICANPITSERSTMDSDKIASARKKLVYQSNTLADSGVYKYEATRNQPVDIEMKNMRKTNQVRRQASAQTPPSHHKHISLKLATWDSVSSCCELGPDEYYFEDETAVQQPFIFRTVRLDEAKNPQNVQKHDLEVVTHRGTPCCQIIGKNGEFSSVISSKHNGAKSQRTYTTASNVPEKNKPFTSNTNTVISASQEHSIPSTLTASDNSTHHATFNNRASVDSSQGNFSSSISTLNDQKHSQMKTPSRCGSTRSSAIAEALSSSVVATATGSIIRKQDKPSCKEEQKSLTERLMTVGPSDSRRVQGIVEDILCEMGEERIIQYKDAFAKFDKDSSGIISSKQLRTLLRTLGHNPSDIELRELVNQVDMDENGKIDFNEFIIMIGYFDKANNENEDLANIFRVFDESGRGCIDVTELRNIWNKFLRVLTPDDSFEEMLNVVDNDGNGEINRTELLEILSTR